MAIIVPDYSAATRESLASLGEGLGQLLFPHRADKKAFERHAAQNPEILQQIRDLAEVQGPSVYTAMKDFVPKDLMATITSLQPTPQAKITIAGRKALAGLSPEAAGAVGLGQQLKLPPEEAARQLAVAPKIAEVAGEQPSEVGSTAAERGAYRAVSGGEAPEGAGEGMLKGQLVQRAGEFLSSLPEKRLQQIGAYASMPSLMNDDHFQQELELHREMWQARNRDRTSELMLRLQEQNAIWWQQKTGEGTSTTWSNYLFGDGRDRVAKLQKGDVSNLKPEDVALLAVDKAFRAAPAEHRAVDLNRADVGVSRTIQAINKAGDASVRAPMIIALNQQLANRAALGGPGPKLHAMWETTETAKKLQAQGGPVGAVGAALGHFKKLRFFDEHNNEVQDTDVTAMLEAPIPDMPPPAQANAAPAAGAPNVSATPAPTGAKDKATRWNEIRVQMFPHIPAGKLTDAQARAVTGRVTSEFK